MVPIAHVCLTVLTTRGTGSQSQMSAFDENTINQSQFVQLTETFMGDNPALEIFQSLCRYLRDGYIETEEEKMARLMRVSQLISQRACNFTTLHIHTDHVWPCNAFVACR